MTIRLSILLALVLAGTAFAQDIHPPEELVEAGDHEGSGARLHLTDLVYAVG